MSASTLHITVRPGEPLRRAFGGYRIEVQLPPDSTLADLLILLARTYPEFAARYAGEDLGHAYPYRLFVNHDLVAIDAVAKHMLADGDLVHIIVPVAGGQ